MHLRNPHGSWEYPRLTGGAFRSLPRDQFCVHLRYVGIEPDMARPVRGAGGADELSGILFARGPPEHISTGEIATSLQSLWKEQSMFIQTIILIIVKRLGILISLFYIVDIIPGLIRN
jgi:hypothetical protein